MVSKSQLHSLFTHEIGGHVDDVFIREFIHWLNVTHRPSKFEKKWLVARAKEFYKKNF